MAKAYGCTLPLRLENNGQFGTNYNLIRQIKSNLTNLILTRKGERPMQPDFGCDVWQYVMEPLTPATIADAYATVIRDVAFWMDYIEVLSFDLANTNDNIDNQTVVMKVRFRIKSNAQESEILVEL